MGIFTSEQIIEELEKKGYHCQANNVIKNSIEMQAINILTETNVSPCIYIEHLFEKYDSIDDIVSEIISIYEKNKDFDVDVLSLLTDRDWILDHLYIALQRQSEEPLIKKLCDDCFSGLEQYLYIRDKEGIEGWSIKLNSSILSLADINEEIAWQYARKNTFAPDEPLLQSLASLIREITGCPDFGEMSGMPELFVLTNKCKIKGSIQVLNKECIDSFISSLEQSTGKRPVKIAVLPSSLHEVLLYPVFNEAIFDSKEEASLTAMVQAVNRETVDPIDVLYDKIFILNV